MAITDITDEMDLSSFTKSMKGNEVFVKIKLLEVWPTDEYFDILKQEQASRAVRAGVGEEFLPQTKFDWNRALTAHFNKTFNRDRALTVDEFLAAVRYWGWTKLSPDFRPADIRWMGLKRWLTKEHIKEIIKLWLENEFADYVISGFEVSISKYDITFVFHGVDE